MRSWIVLSFLLLSHVPARAELLDVALSGNLGFGAPAGLASVMARVDIGPSVFVEGDAGYGTAGREVGGGVGVVLGTERSKTAKLGGTTARMTSSLLVTRSHTDEREAGIVGGPLPELVQGGGTYWWGYLMVGAEARLDSGLYILAEVGLVARLRRDALYEMDPRPDDVAGLNIRGGVGAHF